MGIGRDAIGVGKNSKKALNDCEGRTACFWILSGYSSTFECFSDIIGDSSRITAGCKDDLYQPLESLGQPQLENQIAAKLSLITV